MRSVICSNSSELTSRSARASLHAPVDLVRHRRVGVLVWMGYEGRGSGMLTCLLPRLPKCAIKSLSMRALRWRERTCFVRAWATSSHAPKDAIQSDVTQPCHNRCTPTTWSEWASMGWDRVEDARTCQFSSFSGPPPITALIASLTTDAIS